jgi:4-hydroxythreonine-4-phosphate dehydrogenase
MMFLISDKMRMATLFPLHVPLRQACENISSQGVLEGLGFVRESLISFGISKPVIAVAALNPHGGEGGILGEEEVREIIPGTEQAKKKGWDVRGPFPADTLFYRAAKGEFDAILTMYHDQGRIAMKTMDFGRIIIAMIGVPVLFLTVAHGTAHDIAGKGTADPANFIHVLQFADRIKK